MNTRNNININNGTQSNLPSYDEATGNNKCIRKFIRNLCLMFCFSYRLIFAILLIIMIYIGIAYFKKCPVQDLIPVWLIVNGVFILLSRFIKLYRYIKKLKNIKEKSYILNISIVIFLVIWFFVGNHLIFSVKSIVHYEQNITQLVNISSFNTSIENSSSFIDFGKNYCAEPVYKFSFWLIILLYIFSVWILLFSIYFYVFSKLINRKPILNSSDEE